MPARTVDTLLKPESKATLTNILAGHVIPALAMSADITKMATDDGKVTVTDENGPVANVTIADVKQSNGVIHVIDAVLTPKM